jgi:hypothetical protein
MGGVGIHTPNHEGRQGDTILSSANAFCGADLIRETLFSLNEGKVL